MAGRRSTAPLRAEGAGDSWRPDRSRPDPASEREGGDPLLGRRRAQADLRSRRRGGPGGGGRRLHGLYRIEAATEQAIALAEVLERAGSELAAALTKLRRPVEFRPHLVAVYELEHEGDRLERDALSTLFDGGIDPMVVIRWKDIYERLEEAIDASHHAGNTLESLIVKST